MVTPDGLKLCSRCGESKLAAAFFYAINRKNSSGEPVGDGFAGYCKDCTKKAAVSWQKNNPEKKAASDKKQSQKPERREKGLTRLRLWNEENPRPHRLEQAKEWIANNPDALPVRNGRARAKRLGVEGRGLTLSQWREIRSQWNELCAYCNERAAEEPDHFVPMTKQGLHDPCNILPTCNPCNRSKYNHDPEWWMNTVAKVPAERQQLIRERLAAWGPDAIPPR